MMTPKTDQEFYTWNEEMAAKYNPDAYHEGSGAIVRWIEASRVREILRLLNVRADSRVLEVGVGAGNILAKISATDRTGLDLSPTLLAIARKRLPDATLIEGNAEEFPAALHQRPFDRVYCSEVLEHVQHPEKVVREMASVLAPNGIAVISVPNEKVINRLKGFLQKLGIFRLLFPTISLKMDDEWHLHTFDRALLRGVIGEVFVVDMITAVPFSWLPIRLVAKVHRPVSLETKG